MGLGIRICIGICIVANIWYLVSCILYLYVYLYQYLCLYLYMYLHLYPYLYMYLCLSLYLYKHLYLHLYLYMYLYPSTATLRLLPRHPLALPPPSPQLLKLPFCSIN